MAKGLILSNSKSNTFRRCEKMYEFKYKMKLRKKELALPLFRGDWLHQLLMTFYDGHDWRQRHAALKAQNWDGLFAEEKEELGGNLPEEVERLFRGYLAYYKEEDKLYRVVDSEINEMVDLPNGMRVNIIIDLIMEEISDGTLWIWDHKTVSRFYPEDFMLLDSQLALYFWGAHQMGYNIQGAVLNELITKPPTKPQVLKNGELAKRKNLHSDAYSYYSYVKELGLNPKDYREYLIFLKSRHGEWWRRTRLPRDSSMVDRIVKEMEETGDRINHVEQRGTYIRTARKECQFDCDFLQLCMGQLQGIDIESIIKISYQKSIRPPEQEELKRLWPANIKTK